MSKYLASLWRSNKNLVAFLFLMVLFRSAIADWNVVPSGSMLPTIRIGDRIFVDKMAYDLRVPLTHIAIVHFGDPQRGDIVTIDSAAAHELLVKRVIGVPGDQVALRENVLYVNGVRAFRKPRRALSARSAQSRCPRASTSCSATTATTAPIPAISASFRARR